MVFHPYPKDITGLIPMLKINDVEIERVSSFKCLGILFDENMSWKCHTDMLSNKLSKYTGILNKLKHLPPYILRMLYFSMVNAHMNYGILVLGFRLIACRSPKSVGCQTLDHQGYDGPVSGRHRSGGPILSPVVSVRAALCLNRDLRITQMYTKF